MSGSGGHGGGKKSANAELNLVPYIDLLSTLICFLLITAVWQQISSLPASGQAPSDSPSTSLPDPDRVELAVHVFTDRIEMVAGKQKQIFPLQNQNINETQIQGTLIQWKATWPERKDVTIHSDSKAPYKFLIQMMDLLIQNKFEDVGVNTQ